MITDGSHFSDGDKSTKYNEIYCNELFFLMIHSIYVFLLHFSILHCDILFMS